MKINTKRAARPHDSATQAEAHSEVIDFPDRATPPICCHDCWALFGDALAAAEHAKRRAHLVAIDYRPPAQWRAELMARNLAIQAAAAHLAGTSTEGA